MESLYDLHGIQIINPPERTLNLHSMLNSYNQKEMQGLIDKDGDGRDDRILWAGYTGENDGLSKTILDVDEDGKKVVYVRGGAEDIKVVQVGRCDSNQTIEDVIAKVNGKDEDVVLKGKEVNFTEKAIENGCGFEYNWDFGDGKTSIFKNSNYTYANPGEYTATLTVKCKKCSPSEKTDAVSVTVVELKTETEATVPTDRARKKLGVGEKVNLTLLPTSLTSVVWTFNGNSITSNSYSFTAGDRATSVTITATYKG